ncbi:DUF6660 family protein [Ferruginibacter sp.]
MKIFAFIMAITILILSVMPCMDGGFTNNGEAKTEISKAENQPEHSDSDDCSPFCNCSCCSASVIHQVIFYNYLAKPLIPAKKYSIYNLSSYSDISFSIWQPPKVA